MLIAVVGFPLGLLALWLLRTTRSVTVVVVPDGDGTLIRIFGRVHPQLAEGLVRALRAELRTTVPG